MDKKTHELIEIGLRGHLLENLIDGWTFRVEEPSSNLYLIEGINKKGRKVSSFGSDPEKVLNECLKKAKQFDSRLRIFTKFLGPFCK